LITCKVTVTREDGVVVSYNGLFPSTCDAVVDAIDKFGEVRVQVIAIGENDDEENCPVRVL